MLWKVPRLVGDTLCINKAARRHCGRQEDLAPRPVSVRAHLGKIGLRGFSCFHRSESVRGCFWKARCPNRGERRPPICRAIHCGPPAGCPPCGPRRGRGCHLAGAQHKGGGERMSQAWAKKGRHHNNAAIQSHSSQHAGPNETSEASYAVRTNTATNTREFVQIRAKDTLLESQRTPSTPR